MGWFGGDGGWRQLEGFGVDAEFFVDGLGEEGLGVDGAGEMHVQVGALGKRLEEGVELTGAHGFGCFERAGGAGFAGSLRAAVILSCGFVLSDGGGERRGEDEGESDTSAGHACLPVRCNRSCPRIAQQESSGRGGLAWRPGIAILWVDVLEGAIDRCCRNSLPHRQAKLRRTSPAGDLGCLRVAFAQKHAKAR